MNEPIQINFYPMERPVPGKDKTARTHGVSRLRDLLIKPFRYVWQMIRKNKK